LREFKAMWMITDESLKALGKSQVWLDSRLAKIDLFTPHYVYGPEGKIPHNFGKAWATADGLRNSLYCNMGGGVPVEIIHELVALSKVLPT
jgi:hypothetical protein